MDTQTIIKGRPVHFAIVGCGRISKNHFSALRQQGDHAVLADVCDINPEVRSALSATNIPVSATLSELLAVTTADVVVLATPSGLHAQQTIQIAQSGRHVVTEKPMATRWQDGQRMLEVCDSAGVHLFVVKQNRHNATLKLLKEALEKKRFGRIYLVTINLFWQRPQHYYDSASWRGTWEFDGGAFMNQASHYVDLLHWLIGPIESVHAYMGTLGRSIEVEDTGVLSVRWRCGALGSLNVTMLTYPNNLEGSITILGEKASVRIGGASLNQIHQWKFSEPDELDEKVSSTSYETASEYGFGHADYYANVIDVLQGKAEPMTDGRSGLKSLELLTAAYLSARDGKRVALPLIY
ncbi:MAG: Gfo/Idh/MocA family oxidoreductase [Candidatus Symbiodolus clandestinus]